MTRSIDQRDVANVYYDDDEADTIPIPRIEIGPTTDLADISDAVENLAEVVKSNGISYGDGTSQLGYSNGEHIVTEREDKGEVVITTIAIVEPENRTFLQGQFRASQDGTLLGFRINEETSAISHRQVEFSKKDGAELPDEVAKPAQDFTQALIDVTSKMRERELISTDAYRKVIEPFENPEVPSRTIGRRLKASLSRAAEWIGFTSRGEAV